MRVDFDNTDQIQDYVSVPAGTYLCRVLEVREGVTSAEDVRWSLRLAVDEGEFTGRHATWDSVVFSARGLARVRHVLAAFGLPTKGEVDLDPQQLVDRRAFVTVRPAEYVAPDGTTTRRNEVPYMGYRAMATTEDSGDAQPAEQGAIGEPELPF